MPFSNLTIVSVTGSDTYSESSAWAVIRSCEELLGSKGLLISPTYPSNLSQYSNIKHQPCVPFGYLEYSIFMIYNLAQYIETDYCLVVQNDGWVINGKNWRDEFWDYDYIGAPIMGDYRAELDDLGQINVKGYPINNLNDIDNATLLLNGGFSLRSKRLLEMPRKLGIAIPIHPTLTSSKNEPFQMSWETPVHHEDLFLTSAIRSHLERTGLKFAPFSIANSFSFDSEIAPLIGNVPFNKILGHHFAHKTVLESYDQITAQFPEKYFQNNNIPDHIHKFLDVFINRGYHIKINLI